MEPQPSTLLNVGQVQSIDSSLLVSPAVPEHPRAGHTQSSGWHKEPTRTQNSGGAQGKTQFDALGVVLEVIRDIKI